MSNAFESLFSHQIPAGEAARFFLKLKTAEAPPMEAGAPAQENIFTAPLEEVLKLMAEMVQNEFKTMFAYKVYAQSVRGPEHFAMAKEFEEHAENELEHADFLLRRMAVLSGGPVNVPDIPPPPPLADPVEILQAMIEMEETGVQRWRMLLAVLGDNPTRYTVEGFLTRELEHVDELWQMLPPEMQESGPAAQGGGPPQVVAPPAQQAQAPAEAAPMASPAGAGETPKFAFAKIASSHTQVRRQKSWGDGEAQGKASEIMDSLFKTAAMTKIGEVLAGVAKTAAGTGVVKEILEQAKSPSLAARAGDALHSVGQFAKEHRKGLQGVGLSAGAGAALGGTLKGMQDPRKGESRAGNVASGALRGAALGGLAHAVQASMPNKMIIKRASTASDRAHDRIEAHHVQTKEQRGELYGDTVGRLLGAAGGWHAGRSLAGKRGANLAQVASAGLGQALGARVGRHAGREVDAKTAAVFGKLAFDDRLNMLPQEQAAEQAQQQNESQFYAAKSQEHAEARAQLEASLQEAQQQAQEQQAQLQQLQAVTQANTAAASAATTQALLGSVTAQTEAIKQRQLAAGTTQDLGRLKDTLRQLADGSPSDGNPQGPGDPQGQLAGPAGQAPGAGLAAGETPPGGEQSAQAPTASPEAAASPMPTTQAALAPDGRTPSTPSAYQDTQPKQASTAKAVFQEVAKKLQPGARAAGAAVGGALTGAATYHQSRKGSEGEKAHEAETAKHKDEGFGGARAHAKATAQRAFQEVLEKHPLASSAVGAIPGALMGARSAPAAISSARKAFKNIQELRKD